MDINKFNKEQLEAITYKDGPLLIIAGAGTGKTTVITERIKYLILEKKVKPNEILSLTFTEKAAREMEERVDKIMPYGYTQMWIETFHSFCDIILREEAINIGLNPNYKLMTESNSILFLRRNIYNLNLKYYKPLGNPTKFLEALLEHFSRLKDEDISPNEYIHWAQSQKSKLPPDSQARALRADKNQHKSNDEKIEAEKYLELANAYKYYEQLKIDNAVMDFSDLIANTLLLFRERENILKKYQNQFQYILVDEFQDTNYAQNELAILLSGKKQNITVVADDDQAIYRWRGAAISNVLQFKKNFTGSKIITLTRNYRSTQTILDNAYTLICNNNPNRLEEIEKINKKLSSERKSKGKSIEFIHTSRSEEEAEEIAKKIYKIVLEDQKYDFKDIAILVRANNHAHPITRALQRFNVPYQFLGPGQLFHQEEIKDLIAYLKVLCNLEDSVSLFRVLNMDIFDISGRDINYLLNLARKKNLNLFETLAKADETYLSDKSKIKIKEIYEMMLKHLDRVKKDSAGQIIYYFLIDTGIFKKFTDYKTEKEEKKIQNIAKFFDKLKVFETESEDASVYATVDWIDLMMQLGDSPQATSTDWRDYNAVNILTVHSSKGLEFPVVFLVNLVVNRFPSTERKEKITIPSDLVKEILPDGDYHIQEERRLFYVGMTRAKDLLFFTASGFYGEGKRERKISNFVFETLGNNVIKKPELKTIKQLSLIELTKIYEDKKEKENGILPLKIDYITYSQIQAFDICPLHYKARYINGIPTPFTPALTFGITIHNILKEFYKKIQTGEKLQDKDLQGLILSNWISEGYDSKYHEKEALSKASQILENYYQKFFKPDHIPKAVELPFSFFLQRKSEEINSNRLLKVAGKIDRIDVLEDGKIEIIDYKTGSMNIDQRDSYKLQLGIYALAATLVDHPLLKRKPENIKISLFYVEEGEKITQDVKLSDLEKIENKILEKVNEIENSDFKCSGNMLCGNCEYKMLCNTNH